MSARHKVTNGEESSRLNMTIWDQIKADLDARDKKGFETYGRPFAAHDGRDTLIEAYHEALDLVAYLKKLIIERGV